MTQNEHTISWPHGSFTVLQNGAMCAPATFKLNDGRKIQPFAIAAWEDDGSAAFSELPELLKQLRGEWPCVPFGMPTAREDLPATWLDEGTDASGLGNFFHGPGANQNWTIETKDDASITLVLDYPDDHPIQSVRRRISGDPENPKLIFDLEITPRISCALPIGVHPVFRLPQKAGSAELTIEGSLQVCTYPVQAEPGASLLAEGNVFESLDSAQNRDGTPVDLSRHPLGNETEEIVLVGGAEGKAVLKNHDENYAVSLRWNKRDFPSCNLWISNKGRCQYPWNGAFQAIGIEPVAAPFDLGVNVARKTDNPLEKMGIPCTQSFVAGQVWSTRYSIEVSAI